MTQLSFLDVKKLHKGYNPLKREEHLQDLLFQTNPIAYSNLASIDVRAYIAETLYKNYPNEASVKGAFINKWLLRESTAVSAFELPIGESRVDLCKINGDSYAYEIKTDLDSLVRLKKQIDDYKNVFDYTYVICSRDKMTEVASQVEEDVGIIYYIYKNGDYFFHNYRPSQKKRHKIPELQLKVLSQAEKSRIADFYDMPKKTEDEELIMKLGSEKINKAFKSMLRKRYEKQWMFLKDNAKDIYCIDYQFFFKTCVNPKDVYR